MAKKNGNYLMLDNGTSWPLPLSIDSRKDSISWKLRYSDEYNKTNNRLYLASIVDSYLFMILEMTQKQRNAVCKEIQEFVFRNEEK